MDIKVNDERKRYYQNQGLWSDKTLLDYWEDSVCRFGDREFIVDDLGNRLTYKELDEKAAVLACWMKEKGIQENDTVSVQINPRHEFVITLFACLKIGAIIVPMKMRTGAGEWVRLMKMAETKMHICMNRYHKEDMRGFVLANEAEIDYDIINVFVGKGDTKEGEYTFDEIMKGESYPLEKPKCTGYDVAAILFTSGTTCGSRGVLLTHNNIISSEKIFNEVLHLTEDDIIFMPAPLSHATGFHHGIISPMLGGGKLVLQEKFEVRSAMKIMDKEHCTYSMGATPFIYDYVKLLDTGVKKPSSLKFYICGGAPVPYELTKRAWTDHQIMVCECYGSTESVPHVIVPPEKALDLKGRWSGAAMGAIEVRIVDEHGNDVKPGETGEEISRGPNVFVGYLGDKRSTDAVLDDDGWYYSGDLCYGDGNKYIKISGRKKDIIVRGGENLNINEMEANLLECPGIKDHAFVGMPDKRLGERVCAFIVPKDQGRRVSKDFISGYLAGRKVSKWLWPERVEYIDEIPYTDSGKIKRHELQQELERRMKMGE